MRKTPRWYDDELARHANLVIEGSESREAALVALRVLLRDTYREFGNIILDDWNAPQLTAAIAASRSKRAAAIQTLLVQKEAQMEAWVQEAGPESAAPQALASQIGALREELDILVPPTDIEWNRHQTLFPDFPFRSLRVTPQRYQKIHKMTGHELDMARNIMLAKTGNAKAGADREVAIFDAFYTKIRPLMVGDDTVADAELKLASRPVGS
jgi:hypothetical protein